MLDDAFKAGGGTGFYFGEMLVAVKFPDISFYIRAAIRIHASLRRINILYRMAFSACIFIFMIGHARISFSSS